MIRTLLFTFGLTAVLATGCSVLQTKNCTLLACNDSSSLTLHTADNHWAPGAYRIELTYDGQDKRTCSLTLPASGEYMDLTCTGGSPADYPMATLIPERTCTTSKSGDISSVGCTSKPDEYTMVFSKTGTPTELTVVVYRDDQMIVEKSLSPSYRDNYPNGPECDPTPCKQAGNEVLVP